GLGPRQPPPARGHPHLPSPRSDDARPGPIAGDAPAPPPRALRRRVQPGRPRAPRRGRRAARLRRAGIMGRVPAHRVTHPRITGKRVPIFSVWLPPPEPDDTPAHLIEAPKAPAPTGIGPIDDLVGKVVGKADGIVNDVDAKADPVVDFLSRPGKPAPGGPFL